MAESTLTSTCATRNPGAPQRSSEWIHPLPTSLSHCVAALRRATIAAGACHVPVESDFIQTHRAAPGDARRRHAASRGHRHLRACRSPGGQYGRAECRERGGQYVAIPVVAVSLKKKKIC